MKIAFIGLGNMGAPMAGNLLKARHEVAVCDLDAAAMQRLAAQGARPGASLADTVQGAELVITMLPAASHVDKVITGDGGVLSGLAPGVPIVDCSTIGPAAARQLAARVQAHGSAFADAPVSGGTGGAAAGTLTFMVGGDAALLERITPVLQGMGRHIVHCGAVGNGQVAKLCNNLLLGVTMVGVAEAMSLGAREGMDAQVLAGIINTSTGRCWSADTYNPYPGVIDGAPASRGYSGGFGVDLMLKDLGLAVEAAEQGHLPLPMGALARDLYRRWSAQGQGGLDFSSIIGLLSSADGA